MEVLSMKKNYVLIIFLSFIVFHLLTACSSKNSQSVKGNISQNNTAITDVQKTEETDELNERLKLYKAFLQNEISSEDKEDKEFLYLRDYCNRVVPEEDGIRYALFDMTGDEIPELHILTDISYSIHAVEKNHLVEWFEGDRYCSPLNNRVILQKVELHNIGYIFLDKKGEEVLCVWFGKSGNDYRFSTGGEDIKLSRNQWEKLKKPFSAIGSDRIKWKNIDNLDF